MKVEQVMVRQSLHDFALQHTGNAYNAVHIALANDISVSDILSVGQSLTIPDSVVQDNATVKFWNNQKFKPASSSEDIEAVQEGIEFWEIETEFLVS